jgi:hypothetical protein
MKLPVGFSYHYRIIALISIAFLILLPLYVIFNHHEYSHTSLSSVDRSDPIMSSLIDNACGHNWETYKTNTIDVMIVVASYKHNTSWLSKLDLPYIIYTKEDPSSNPKYNLPDNRGHEATIYLRYIIDHYETLPREIVFIHDHGPNKHSPHLIETLKSFKWNQKRYRSLNYEFFQTCEREVNTIIKDLWSTIGEWLGPMPPYFNDWCCGQFVVHRCNIWRHPKQFYERYFNWFYETDLMNFYNSRAAEWTWGYVFGRPYDGDNHGGRLRDIVHCDKFKSLVPNSEC